MITKTSEFIYTENTCTEITKEEGMIVESKTTINDEFGRISKVTVNNRKVEFKYDESLSKDDIKFDLAIGVVITEKGDDNRLRTIEGEGSITVEGNILFHRLPQYFGLTDDEPCIKQLYLSVYLINDEKTNKGLIAEKIFVNEGSTPDQERYITYQDNNFEKINTEVACYSGIFTKYIESYIYDTLGRIDKIFDYVGGTTESYTYHSDGRKIKRSLYDNKLGGIDANALMYVSEDIYDDENHLIQTTVIDYTI